MQDDPSRPRHGPGKRRSGQVVKPSQPVPVPALPTLTDERDPAGRTFLVDTGATASIYPASFLEITELARLTCPAGLGRQMYAVNGSEVRLLGRATKTFRFAGRYHRHEFLIADLDRPLLGYNFLQAHHVMVQAKDNVIIFGCECPRAEHMYPELLPPPRTGLTFRTRSP